MPDNESTALRFPRGAVVVYRSPMKIQLTIQMVIQMATPRWPRGGRLLAGRHEGELRLR